MSAENGVAGTGGGGGGSGWVSAGDGVGGKGGSGIVIVRYYVRPPQGTVFMFR